MATSTQDLGVNDNTSTQDTQPIDPNSIIDSATGIEISTGANIPYTTNQVDPYLNQVQNQMFSQLESGETPFEAPEQFNQIQQTVAPQQQMPEAPSFVDLYTQLSQERGLEDMTKNLNELEKERMAIEARLRQRKTLERGKAVASNVISGRISEVERQELELMDFVGRQINYKANQIKAAQGYIQMVMDFTNMDYQNAMQRYDQQFQQNLAIYKQFRSEEQFQQQMDMEEKNYQLRKEEFDLKWKQIETDNAKANIQMYTDLISKGITTWESMNESTKAMLSGMAVQAGLPPNFLQGIKLDPAQSIKHIGTRTDANGNKYADMLVMQPDGSLKVQSQYIGKEYVPRSGGGGRSSGGSGSSSATWTTTQFNSARKMLSTIDHNSDRLLSAAEETKFLDYVYGLVGGDIGKASALASALLKDYKRWTPSSQKAGQNMAQSVINAAGYFSQKK